MNYLHLVYFQWLPTFNLDFQSFALYLAAPSAASTEILSFNLISPVRYSLAFL